MTVLEVIQRSADFLARKGVEAPRLQVEWLLAHQLGIPRLQLYLQFDRPLAEADLAAVRDLVQRRGRREPLQHILGTALFHSLEFKVDGRVLIPRPETELLAELALARVQSRAADPLLVLDFGTGSGCLAITLAHHLPNACVHAVDLSPDALTVAHENAVHHQVDHRIQFRQGDGFAPVPPDLRFDLIVANPPYIPSGDICSLEPEVKNHDPHLALDGGPDGMRVQRRLASESARWLRPHGSLLVELGDGQEPAARSLFTEHNWVVEQVAQDYTHRPRVLIAQPAAETVPHSHAAEPSADSNTVASNNNLARPNR
jgi:release factor glutamine methyltransferase